MSGAAANIREKSVFCPFGALIISDSAKLIFIFELEVKESCYRVDGIADERISPNALELYHCLVRHVADSEFVSFSHGSRPYGRYVTGHCDCCFRDFAQLCFRIEVDIDAIRALLF
jgi:hypothetical protein